MQIIFLTIFIFDGLIEPIFPLDLLTDLFLHFNSVLL